MTPAISTTGSCSGLKGTMSEAELHFIRARLIGGQLSKARRGELQMPLPVGLVYDGAGKVVLDPDSGVQNAVGHLFALFARTGSARAVVQEYNAAGLLFPVRVRTGGRKGDLAWMPLRHWRVLRTLHNPRYAGAFAYGRRRERIGANGKKTFQTLPRDQWIALIPDSHPGYLSWEQYEANQQLLLANARARGTDRTAGPPREGPALLQGMVICGRCGSRMTVRYHTRRGIEVPDYQCMRHAIQDGGRRCQTVPGGGVDAAVGQLLLDTLTPLALEVALTVQAELETRADEADALRRQHVQRAQHRADLARRRYLGVDPGNRLVADSLEADWNDALRGLQTAQDDYDKATAAAMTTLTEKDKTRIRALAADFPALWASPATPQRERKRMTRLLIEDVTLVKTSQIHLHVRLRGGQTTSLTIPIPPKAWQARQTSPRHPGRPRPAPRRAHRQRSRAAAQPRRPPLRRRKTIHRPHRARAAHQQQPAQPRRPAPRPGTAQHQPDRRTTRRPPHHDQELAQSRAAAIPQSQRQERAALPAARPRRPPPRRPTGKPHQEPSSTQPAPGGAL